MDMLSLMGLAVATAVAAFTVRQYNPQIAVQVSLAGGAVIALSVIAELSGIAQGLSTLASAAASADAGGTAAVNVIIKAVGIAYLARIASELCRDMGENALAVKAEILGRVMLLSLAMPLVTNIAELLTELIRNSL